MATMHCPNCGKTIEDDMRFCPYCGHEIDADLQKLKDENQQNESLEDVQYDWDEPGKKDVPKKKGFLHSKKGRIIIGIVVIVLIFGIAGNMGSDEKKSSSKNTMPVVEKKQEVKVTAISATYSGDTDAGTVLDDDNDDITVTADYSDDTSKTVTGWSIDAPATLKAGRTSRVMIRYKGKSCLLKVKCTTLTKAQIRRQYNKTIPYNSLARYPDKYKSKPLKIYGKVVQVMQDDDDENKVQLRISTKNDGYGWYDNIVFVEYTYGTNDKKILEDDMVTVYGLSAGTVTYESTGSGNITIPAMLAGVIDIH